MGSPRNQRLKKYTALRLEGATSEEAGKGVGLKSPAIVRYYEERFETATGIHNNRIMDKDEVCALVTRMLRDPKTPPQYKSSLISQLSSMCGYGAPKGSGKDDSKAPTGNLSGWMEAVEKEEAQEAQESREPEELPPATLVVPDTDKEH
jgi:hypothetical protein